MIDKILPTFWVLACVVYVMTKHLSLVISPSEHSKKSNKKGLNEPFSSLESSSTDHLKKFLRGLLVAMQLQSI